MSKVNLSKVTYYVKDTASFQKEVKKIPSVWNTTYSFGAVSVFYKDDITNNGVLKKIEKVAKAFEGERMPAAN